MKDENRSLVGVALIIFNYTAPLISFIQTQVGKEMNFKVHCIIFGVSVMWAQGDVR